MPDDAPSALPGEARSLWMATAPGTEHPPLSAPLDVDVAVLGAGIAGVLTAVRLKEAGRRVALLDARRVLSGATGHTTAKVTSLHRRLHVAMVDAHGDEAGRAYADASQWAVREIERWARERRLDCDWAAATAYTYAETPDEVAAVEREADVARRIGLPVRLTKDVGLPFPVEAAVALADQGRYHPRRFLLPLAASVEGGGSAVLEETVAREVVEGSPCVVRTNRGEVRANDVVVATHQPFMKAGTYYARLRLKRSYALGVRLGGPVPQGLYISAGDDFRSMRPARDDRGDLLLVGGGSHETGQSFDTDALVRSLDRWARTRFDVREVAWRWATQDLLTPDGLPYVGRLLPASPHVFVATGFGGWGMTNGMVASAILSDLVLGRENRWAPFFDPGRVGLGGRIVALGRDAMRTTKDLTGAFDRSRDEAESEIAPGEGRVVSWGFEKLAVSRDEAGVLHEVSAVCTHMQCVVRWNRAERSWDCPCHGSRFDPDGRVLHGPATEPLAKDAPDDA